jgi:hypothetical protein
MIDFIPYFAGLITLIFGIGFGYSLYNAGKKKNSE